MTAPRSPTEDHYDTLEVSPNASPEVLRAAYKSLIQRLHPDRNPGDPAAAARSARVVRAYQVLSDPAARAAYDRDRQCSARPAAERRDRAAPGRRRSSAVPVLWIMPVLVLAFLAWLVWRETAMPLRPVAVGGAPASPAAPRQTARTIDDYLTGIEVTLDARPPVANGTGGELRARLQIRTLSLVAGGFDAERFVEFAQRNRDYIRGKLGERLAGADYRRLVGDDGEVYLKRLIVDALAEISNTRRPEPSAHASHYGVAAVLLPDGFTVEPPAVR